MGIILKSAREIAKMREAGRVVNAVLDAVEKACVPGVTTWDLNRIAERIFTRAGCRSAFLGYAPGSSPPYPAVLCTSRNHEVVHGIPRPEVVLAEGDILGIDFACFKDGYCADAARTVAVGVISEPGPSSPRRHPGGARARHHPLHAGQPPRGHRFRRSRDSLASKATRSFASWSGTASAGAMHEQPEVRNFGRPGRGLRLRPGMVIAIEPMVNQGQAQVSTLADGWTVVTDDRSLSAHFEHTVAITEAGPQVLTAP